MDLALGRQVLRATALMFLIPGLLFVASTSGERSQYGRLIVSLDGRLSPLTLPRERLAPVSVELEGSLRTADGSPLPRVRGVELGLPEQGVLSTEGLPTCMRRKLVVTTSADALRACRDALVGRGRADLTVQVPNQEPFAVHTRLLAFNARIAGRRAVLLHAYTPRPPLAVVLAFFLRRSPGRFGRTLAARLPMLGEWARVAHFEMSLSRRYRYRGRSRSFLSASCPVPKRFTAGFFSFARISYRLTGGHQVSTAIARTCRAR